MEKKERESREIGGEGEKREQNKGEREKGEKQRRKEATRHQHHTPHPTFHITCTHIHHCITSHNNYTCLTILFRFPGKPTEEIVFINLDSSDDDVNTTINNDQSPSLVPSPPSPSSSSVSFPASGSSASLPKSPSATAGVCEHQALLVKNRVVVKNEKEQTSSNNDDNDDEVQKNDHDDSNVIGMFVCKCLFLVIGNVDLVFLIHFL